MKRAWFVVAIGLLMVGLANGETLKTFVGPNGAQLRLTGINNQGTMVGYWQLGVVVQSVSLDPNSEVFTDLPLPAGIVNESEMYVTKINENGDVAGNITYVTRLNNFWKLGVSGDQDLMAKFSIGNYDIIALSVNNHGDLAGTYHSPTGRTAGFCKINGALTTVMVPGASLTIVSDLNDRGDICGRFASFDGKHQVSGFTRINGSYKIYDFPGAINTRVWGINNNGDVVGTFQEPGSPDLNGFIVKAGKMSNYVAGGQVVEPQDLNDLGQVVGFVEGQSFLATP